MDDASDFSTLFRGRVVRILEKKDKLVWMIRVTRVFAGRLRPGQTVAIERADPELRLDVGGEYLLAPFSYRGRLLLSCYEFCGK